MIGMNVLLGNQPDHDRIYGVTIAVVMNLEDPENLGRVRVKFPWLSDRDETDWVRVLTPMAGSQYGCYMLPDVGDEVLVAFDQGDPRFPYILGSLWNGKNKPPETHKEGKNNHRMIKSKSGHTIILDDTEGEEKIIIRDKTTKNEISIDSKTNLITIRSEKDLAIETKGNISFKSSGGNFDIECNTFSVQAKQGCEIKANTTCAIEAQAGVGIKSVAGVKINDGALEVI